MASPQLRGRRRVSRIAKPVDPAALEYAKEVRRVLDRIPVTIFMCGSGLVGRGNHNGKKKKLDVRLFMRRKLKDHIPRCDVRLGEHSQMIKAFQSEVGKSSNLADHEFTLALRKKIDLVVIFPCSPGSFAELGMFSIVDKIAMKMVVFVDKTYRGRRSFLIEGPVRAAKLRTARISFVDYSKAEAIWANLQDIVLEIKNRKRAKRALAR